MHTAEHLVTKCLGGELARNRTVILVTHHVTLCLPLASYVLKLDQGKVLHQGTISELESKGVLMSIIDAEEEPFPEAEPISDKPTNDADAAPVGNSEHAKPAKTGKLIEAEAIAEGKVSLKTYITYLKAGGFSFWVLAVAIQVAIRAINVVYQVRTWTWLNSGSILPVTRLRSFLRDGARHTKGVKLMPLLFFKHSRSQILGLDCRPLIAMCDHGS